MAHSSVPLLLLSLVWWLARLAVSSQAPNPHRHACSLPTTQAVRVEVSGPSLRLSAPAARGTLALARRVPGPSLAAPVSADLCVATNDELPFPLALVKLL